MSILTPSEQRWQKHLKNLDIPPLKKRIETFTSTGEQPKSLAVFVGNPREPMPQGLPFHLRGYIELVDWTGRVIRADKR